MKAPFLIGRILFGGFFLYSGINHLRQRKGVEEPWEASVPVARPSVGDRMRSIARRMAA